MIDITNYTDWNKKIIFAPNATGKSTVSEKIFNAIKKNYNAEILTARTIRDLIGLKRDGIYIGKAAKNLAENETIEENMNKSKTNILESIFANYGVTNATNLRKKSFTFSYFGISNDKLADFIKKFDLLDKELHSRDFKLSYEDAISLDMMLELEDYNFVNYINNEKSALSFLNDSPKSKESISKELFNYLVIVKNNISQLVSVCPLCGYDYKQYEVLIEKINEKLNNYMPDDKVKIYEQIDYIWNKFVSLQKKCDFDKYGIQLNVSGYSAKVVELIKLLSLFIEVRSVIVEKTKNDLKKASIDKDIHAYKTNRIKIVEEQAKLKGYPNYYNDIINNYRELINLPSTLDLQILDDKLFVFDNISKKPINPADCLSESEIKRLSLIVLKYQIKYANLEYIIFDDPIDSYDDYFLKRASVFIANLINENSNLNWVVFSHVFELVYILNREIKSTIAKTNVFYIFDPSYKYDEIKSPNLLHYEIPEKHIKALIDHETIIVDRVFQKQRQYLMTPEFAMLAAISTTRNIASEIFPKFNISFLRSKITRNVINLENRYLHFSNRGTFKISELFLLYAKMYANFAYNMSDIVNPGLECIHIRTNLLNLGYSSISCENELIKAIFYNIIRVSECKYCLEKKLINRMISFYYPAKEIEKIFRERTLGKKIKLALKIEDDLSIASNLKEFDDIHEKFSIIFNDFSHGTVRMFPPYLSINSFDISKFQFSIDTIR